MHIRKSYNDCGNIFLISALFYEVLERKTEHDYPFRYLQQSTASTRQPSCAVNGVFVFSPALNGSFSLDSLGTDRLVGFVVKKWLIGAIAFFGLIGLVDQCTSPASTSSQAGSGDGTWGTSPWVAPSPSPSAAAATPGTAVTPREGVDWAWANGTGCLLEFERNQYVKGSIQKVNHRVIQKLVVTNMTSRPLRFRARFSGSIEHEFGPGHGSVGHWTLSGPNAGFDVPAGPGTFPIKYNVWTIGKYAQRGDYKCSVTNVKVTYLQ
jgi:hypothetical protein